MGYTSVKNKYIQQRIHHIRGRLAADNITGLLIFTEEFRPSYSLYISDYCPIENIEFSPQAVFITQSEVILFLGALNKEAAKDISWIKDIRDIDALIPYFQSQKQGCKIGLSGVEKLPLYYKKQLDKIAHKVDFIAYDFAIDNLRLYKDEDEIRNLKMASIIADEAVAYMLDKVKADISTEANLAAEGEFYIRNKGLDLGYDTIIASGRNIIDRTHRPKPKIIKNGEVLLLNIVPKYNGYCAFLTLTTAMNNPYAQAICSQGKAVIQYMVNHLKAAEPASRIYDLYYEKTKEYGLLKHFLPFGEADMPIGHSIGLDVVEQPIITKNSDIILENHMVLSLKYFLYDFAFGDVRFEFTIAMNDKAVLLNKSILES